MNNSRTKKLSQKQGRARDLGKYAREMFVTSNDPAALQRVYDCLGAYFKNGGKADLLSNEGESLLGWSIGANKKELFDYLLNKGFDINKHYNFGSAVTEAWLQKVQNHNSYYFDALVKAKADLEIANNTLADIANDCGAEIDLNYHLKHA